MEYAEVSVIVIVVPDATVLDANVVGKEPVVPVRELVIYPNPIVPCIVVLDAVTVVVFIVVSTISIPCPVVYSLKKSVVIVLVS